MIFTWKIVIPVSLEWSQEESCVLPDFRMLLARFFPEEQTGQFQENKHVLYIPVKSQVPKNYRAKDGVPPTTPPAVTCCPSYGLNPV